MRWLKSLFHRVHNLVRTGLIHQTDEAQFQIDKPAKEQGFEVRGSWLDTLWLDLRYSVRMLLNNPGFTVVSMIILALGIGANTTIFSVANAVLFRPLPYEDPRPASRYSGYPSTDRSRRGFAPGLGRLARSKSEL